MKLLNRFLVVLLILFLFLVLRTNNAYAHCHQLTDPAGDLEGSSSFSFVDIVSTTLSDNGDTIGVKITTAGNIPDGFGTTAEMGFVAIFPASLLSGDPNDTGVNAVTVHWTTSAQKWEGSQFIYRGDDFTPIPWSANLVIDGKTASFNIPKKIIGQGIIAYQITTVFLSEEGEGSDSAPSGFIFSDCYQETAVVSSPQAETKEGQPSKPQTPTEGPTKEGNKIIEKPGVVRTTSEDVGKSLAVKVQSLPSPSPVSRSADSTTTTEGTDKEVPSPFADLALIALIGIIVTGSAYLLLRKTPGFIALAFGGKKIKEELAGDPLPRLSMRHLAQIFGFAAGAGAGGGGAGKPCINGTWRKFRIKRCKFLLLDPNGEIKIETNKWFEGRSINAKKIASWLGHVDAGTKGQTKDPRYQPWFLKTAEVAKMFQTDKYYHSRDKNLARQFKVVAIEIPTQWRFDTCKDWEECINGKWVPMQNQHLLYVLGTKIKIDAKRDTHVGLDGVTFDDFPQWLEKYLKEKLAHPRFPCDC